MMDEIVTYAQRHRPLAVSAVEEDSDGVLVAGESWHLPLTRIGMPAALVSRVVVDFGITYHGPYGDTPLTFDNSSTLEALSDFPYGEWIFSIWNTDDPKRLPVFDLSGPCSRE